jgi:hypothetical protein
MERIDPIGPWPAGIPQVDRVAPSKRSGERRGGERSPGRREEDAEPQDDEDRGDDDGHSHVDISA